MSNDMSIDKFEGLVNYLGIVLGSQYEILLQDMKKRVLLAVANGYITLRVKGGPITSFAETIDAEQIWKKVDYLTNLKCKTASDHLILTSIYFIKTDEELLGLLCINYDTTQYSDIDLHAGDLHNMFNLFSHSPENNAQPPISSSSAARTPPGDPSPISVSAESLVDQVVQEYCSQNNTSPMRLKYNEKQNLIERLYQKDVFQVKGAISYVAKTLNSSDTTIYRYLRGIKEKR